MDRSPPENVIHSPRAESVVSSSSITVSERRSVSFRGDNNSEAGGAPSEIWEFQWEEGERALIVPEPKASRKECAGCCIGRGAEEDEEDSDEDDDPVGTSIFGSLFRSNPIGKR